jgi:uncharacterized protein (DUF433 family)
MMGRDYREQLDIAAAAAADGATVEEIIAETDLELADIRKIIFIEEERRKRREMQNGRL